jgi:hypothetical protein
MKKRIALLITARMLALSISFGVAGGAFAAKSTTFSKGASRRLARAAVAARSRISTTASAVPKAQTSR